MMTKKRATAKIPLLIVISLLGISALICAVFYLSVILSADYVKFDAKKMPSIEKINSLTILSDSNDILSTDFLNGLDIDALSQDTINAILVTEDKRFFSHNGFDLRRMAGAAFQNLKYGKFKEGASTLTQQLAKNVFLSSEKSLKRKINELNLAIRIEKHYTKNEILTMYLNSVYFGSGAYGITQASKKFFGKTPYELTVAESAALAGLLKSPTNYSPFFNYECFLKRKDLVLLLMYENDVITKEKYLNAKNEQLTIGKQNESLSADKNYITKVISDALDILNVSYQDFIKLDCTIKTFYCSSAKQALDEAMASNVTTTLTDKIATKTAIVIDNKTRGVKAFYGKSDQVFNKKIHPASTLKPLAVYSPALEMGYISPITPVLDEKTIFAANFSPSNYKDIYYGWTTVRESVKNSLNIPAVKTAALVGIENCVDYLNKNGFSIDSHRSDLALALGKINGECSLAKLANGYCTLANQGNFCDFSLIKSIQINGKTIYNFNPTKSRVFSEQTAFLMTDMLCGVTESGTAKKMSSIKFDVAGKTGTNGVKNGNNSNALFCGYTTQDTFAFNISGPDETYELSNKVVGGKQPTELAKVFLNEYYVNKPPLAFTVPQKIKLLKVDKNALKTQQKVYLSSEENDCEFVEDYFNEDYAPKTRAEHSRKLGTDHHKTPLTLDVSVSENMVFLSSSDINAAIYLEQPNGSGKFIAIGSGIYFVNDTTNEYTFFAENDETKSIPIKIIIKDKQQNRKSSNENRQNHRNNKISDFWRKIMNID